MENKKIKEIVKEAQNIAKTSYEEAYNFLLEEMEGMSFLINKEKSDLAYKFNNVISNQHQVMLTKILKISNEVEHP